MASGLCRYISHETGYAHVEGFTCVAYSKDGRTLLTGGSDGDVRVWVPDDPNHESRSISVGSNVYGLAVKDEIFYAATDNMDLNYYSIKDGSVLGTKVRFTLGIYCLDVSQDGKLLAAGAADFMIKIVYLEDDSLQSLNGHKSPILSVALDPQKKFCASSSCDGTVSIWDIESLERLKTWFDNHPRSNDFSNSKSICNICWSKKGNYFIIPSKEGISIYNRGSWSLKINLKQQGFEDPVACAVSCDDKFLAAANRKGMVVIWSLSDQNFTLTSIFASEKSSPVTCIRWNPVDGKKLIVTDEKGEYHLLEVKPDKAESAEDYNTLLQDINFDEDLDELDEDNSRTRKNSNDSPKKDISKQPCVNDERSKSPSQQNPDSPAEMNLEDEENEIDIGKIKAEYEPKIFRNEEEEKTRLVGLTSYLPPSKDPAVAEAIKKINDLVQPILQSPFQPGSSPVDFAERYMKWNSVGVILSRQEDNENNIYIEFHDTAISHSKHFSNIQSYTMADLSLDAIAFATPYSEENPSSHIFCMILNGMGDIKEWKLELPKDEYAEAIALGDGFLAVATDSRNIRLFTTAGLQLFIFTIPGPIVCLSAQERSLMIIFHSGSGLPAEQTLSMMIIKIDTKNLIKKRHQLSQPVPVALSPLSTLSWAGFSDEGSPCTVDSSGIVRLYKDFVGNFWVPILDFRTQVKNKADHYFIIGLTEIGQHVRSVLCKGSKYPTTVPRPAPVNLAFELPIANRDTQKGQLEEKYMLQTMCSVLVKSLLLQGYDVDFQVEETEKKLKETLVKLFALCLTTNADTMALEVADLMMNPKSLEGARRYAIAKRKGAVANAIEKLMRQRAGEVEEEVNEPEVQIHAPSPQKNSFLLDGAPRASLLFPKPLSKPRPSTSGVNCKMLFGKDDQSNGQNSDDKEEMDQAFEIFLKKNRESIESNYEVESEDDIIRVARKKFEKLSRQQKLAFCSKNGPKDLESSQKKRKLNHKY